MAITEKQEMGSPLLFISVKILSPQILALSDKGDYSLPQSHTTWLS